MDGQKCDWMLICLNLSYTWFFSPKLPLYICPVLYRIEKRYFLTIKDFLRDRKCLIIPINHIHMILRCKHPQPPPVAVGEVTMPTGGQKRTFSVTELCSMGDTGGIGGSLSGVTKQRVHKKKVWRFHGGIFLRSAEEMLWRNPETSHHILSHFMM